VNEVICHGIPDARPLQEGDIVNVDVSVFLNGYHGDLNETFFVGKVDDVSRRLVQTTYECLQKAIEIGRSTRTRAPTLSLGLRGRLDSRSLPMFRFLSNLPQNLNFCYVTAFYSRVSHLTNLLLVCPAVKPGVLFREVGEVISRHASMNTFQVVSSRVCPLPAPAPGPG
jgi:Xaa-Pro aminopeptidase